MLIRTSLLLQNLLGVVYWLRVVALQEPHPHGVVAVEIDGPLHVEDVAQRLCHLVADLTLQGEVDHPMVRPGPDEGALRMRPGALGELVLVVRKAQVRAAAVDVRSVRQVLLDHRRALDVPAGPSRPPRTRPGGLAGLGGLPEREVSGAPLVAGLGPLGLAHLFWTLLAQGSVFRVAPYIVVDVAVAGSVGVALLDKLLDQRDHLRDVLGGPWLYVRAVNPEKLQPIMEGVGVAAYDLLPGDTFLVGLVDNLILYVRDVLDEGDLVTPAPQIPCDHVPEQRRAGVANVNVVVDCRPADVEADLAVFADLDGASTQGVSNKHAHAPSLASSARFIRLLASRAPSTARRYAISGPLLRPVRASLRGCKSSRGPTPFSFAQSRSSWTRVRALSRSSVSRSARAPAA